MPMTSAEMLLPAAVPFDLRATALSNGYHQTAPCLWITGARPALARVERLEERGVYLIRLRATPANDAVIMRVTGPDADQVEALAPLAVRMRRVLRLDESFAEFHRLCRPEPSLRAIQRLKLGPLLRGATLWEDIVKAIACTNASWRGAVEMLTRLGQLGSPCGADRSRRAFPTPAQIIRAGDDVLRHRVRLGFRATYVDRLAREVTEGLRDLDRLDRQASSLSAEALTTALRDIAGIGPAATAWLSLLLGRYDGAGLHEHAGARFATGLASPVPTPAMIATTTATCAPWRNLALWFHQWLASDHPAVAELYAHAP